jgi:hypothetical protein
VTEHDDERAIDETAIGELRATIAAAVERLSAAGARTEALAQYVPEHRTLLIKRNAVMTPIGRVWRLGVFLLGEDGTLYRTGSLTRAVEPGRPAYQSLSAETRREYRAAASRGKFTEGESVNYDAEVIELTAEALHDAGGPLFLHAGAALVRWNPRATADTATRFSAYLADRVELAVNPPAGAN